MDQILQTLLSWQFIIFGLAISAIVFVVRKIVEYLIATSGKIAKESKLWKDLILPILPVILGASIACFLKSFPYPEGLVQRGDRIVFGLVAGLISTVLYRILNALFVQKLNSTLGANVVSAEETPTENTESEVKSIADQLKQTNK